MAYQQNQVYGQQATPQPLQQQDVVSGDQYRYALTNFVSTDHLSPCRLLMLTSTTILAYCP
jgi:hypothetical protein